jgi:malonyl-CoA/methylmalonyl-CoA synthetase
MTVPGAGIRLIDRAKNHGQRTAIISEGTSHTYSDLLRSSEAVARTLLEGVPSAPDLREKRAAFLIPASFEYVAVQWGIWRAGGIAVPLSVVAQEPEFEHVLTDAGVSLVITTGDFRSAVDPLW